MSRRTKVVLAIAVGVLVLALGGIGTAYALAGDHHAVSGPAADQARAAAVQAVPGGRAGTVDRETTEGDAA